MTCCVLCSTCTYAQVYDLQYASPATISRCGMVYVDSRNLGYRPYVWTWLNGRTKQSESDVLRSLFEKYAHPCVDWVLEGIDGDDLVRVCVGACAGVFLLVLTCFYHAQAIPTQQ